MVVLKHRSNFSLLKSVQKLVDAGTDTTIRGSFLGSFVFSNVLDDEGNSILHFLAEKEEYTSLLEELLSKRTLDVNVQNIDIDTPLHFAADYQNNKAIKILLKYGADPNICGRNGQSRIYTSSYLLTLL